MNPVRLLLVALVLLAGCAAGPATDTSARNTAGTGGCVDDISFWGLNGGGDATRWSPNEVRIAYTLPPSTDALFVAYENETVLGWTYVRNGDPAHAIASDGDVIRLRDRLHGTHTIHVTVYRDANGNSTFDPGVDAPCRREGDPVRTEAMTVDFDAIAANGTTAT